MIIRLALALLLACPSFALAQQAVNSDMVTVQPIRDAELVDVSAPFYGEEKCPLMACTPGRTAGLDKVGAAVKLGTPGTFFEAPAGSGWNGWYDTCVSCGTVDGYSFNVAFRDYTCPAGYNSPNTGSPQFARAPDGTLVCYRWKDNPDPAKNDCAEDCTILAGNPFNAKLGTKHESAVDVSIDSDLTLHRFYSNSAGGRTETGFGKNWTSSFSSFLIISEAYQPSKNVFVTLDTGQTLVFRKDGAVWKPDSDIAYRLDDFRSATPAQGWKLTSPDDTTYSYSATGKLSEVRRRESIVTLAYDPAGQLQMVSNAKGRSIKFVRNADGTVAHAEASDGKQVKYTYDAHLGVPRLTRASYPDSTVDETDNPTVEYVYDQFLLIGINDENSQRYATWQYSGGKVVSSFHGPAGSGIDLVTADYLFNGSTTITGSSGVKTMSFENFFGTVRLKALSCAGCPDTVSNSFDDLGRVDKQTDASGSVSDFDFDSRGHLTQKIEATNDATGKKRKVQTDWHATFNVPIERRIYDSSDALVAKSTWSYNARGQALTQTRTDPLSGTSRVTTTTYCEQSDITAGACPLLGLVRSVNGPRTDVSDITTYIYRMADEASCAIAPATCLYRKGDLWKVTNALTQITETLKYDGAGRPLSVKDPNGVITDLEYHARGWLTASKRRGTNAGSEDDDQITRIEYWPTGLAKKVTQPDGAFTSYTYDAAHRLTDITDNAGNTIHYVLDNAGNRTSENTKDNTGALKRTLSRVYNQLGQLQTQTDAYAHTTGFTYDANGNADTVTDALTRITDSDHDPLNRLSRTLQDVGGIAAETGFQYDAQDNLTKVTDPKGLDTTYAYNGLGDLLQLSSPDTGITGYTYDSAGNRKTQADARNKTATYGYDSLNRLTGITYPTTSLNVVYTYDTTQAVCTTGETFTKGRLTKITDASGTTQYCYDRFGQLVRKHQLTNGVALTVRYSYTPAGRLQSLTYPDGQTAIYSRDGQGRTTAVSVAMAGGECQQVLVSGVQYAPFGPATAWMFGDGSSGGSGPMEMRSTSPQGAVESSCFYPPTASRPFARILNLNYQPAAVADALAGGLFLGYEFDPVGNLSKLRTAQQTDPPLATYTYDALNRLTDTKDGSTGTVIEHYAYDATGNRLSLTHPAGVTTPYTYPATSHRLGSVGATARSYDATGNTTQIGSTARQFDYNDIGRMSQVKAGSTVTMQYAYNGKGEQVRKYLGTTNTYTVYDEAGHWLGDYNNTGAPIQQAVWMDDLPVGLMASNGLNYVEADALGTPRVVIDPVRDVAIWRWDLTGEVFGNTAPNQNPDGDTNQFVFNMRFPGQRYDAASGLNYNYFRDYEASIGRYVESDPIGLRGGISTYGYAAQSPLVAVDKLGLKVIWKGSMTGAAAIDGVGAGFFLFDLTSECTNGKQAHAKVFASSVAGGFGAKWTGSGSAIQMHDWTDTPNPDVFNGVFVMASGGIVAGGGGGCSKVTLGDAYSDGFCGGPVYGFDFSAGVYVGASMVIGSPEVTDCQNCD